MRAKRVPVLVGVALAGTTLLTATALGAVRQGRPSSGRASMAAGLTSSVTQNGVQVKAAAGAARVAAGGAVPVTVTVRSQSARTAVVDLEAYDPAGRRVFQRFWSDETLSAGLASTWTATWTAPAGAGRYRIAIGVFTDGWGSVLAWNNRAAFVVVAPTGSGGAVAGQPPGDDGGLSAEPVTVATASARTSAGG